VPDAAQNGHLVRLELHPGTAAKAEPAPGQGISDVATGNEHVSRQPFEDCHESRAVRLAGCQPSEHDQKSGTGAWSVDSDSNSGSAA
jgi:hypothetical protein